MKEMGGNHNPGADLGLRKGGSNKRLGKVGVPSGVRGMLPRKI